MLKRGVVISILSTVALTGLFSFKLLLAATSPGDYVQRTFEPATFSKKAIVGDETFTITFKSKWTCVQDLARPAKAGRFAYRYSADNKTTGEHQVLNAFYGVRVEPFPLTIGQTYETANTVQLKFPAGTKPGDYMVVEELTASEMKAPEADWVSNFDSSRPPEPRAIGMVKYSPTASTTPPPVPTPEPTTVPPPPPAPEPAPTPEPSPTSEPAKVSAPALAPTSTLSVSSLSLSATSAFTGGYFQGTVVLGGAAPAGGQVVSLSATPSGLLTLPASITVPAGAKSGSFGASVKAAFSFTSVTIRAAVGNSSKTASVKIFPITVSLNLSPASVVGGFPSVGTVTLNTPAPAEAQVVQLSATPNSLLTIPSSVKLTGGMTKITFNISTKSVRSAVRVGISATLKSSQITTMLTINPPPVLSAISISPDSVTGGSPSVGTVTLNGPAPSGGSVVKLAVNSNLVTVPANVAVKEGATSATFNIQTKAVSASGIAVITASYNGIEATTRLTVSTLTLSVLAVSPLWVQNGVASVGHVFLNGPAPSGGQVVKISSGGNAPISFPASVTVKAGATSATFDIQTKAVSTLTKVPIWAGIKGYQKSDVLTIMPFEVSNLTLSPAVALNGAPAVGTVTLSGAALAGGQVVKLSTEPANLATVPATMTVKAGATSATFDIKTTTPPLQEVVTIIAAANDSKKTALLTVGPSVMPTTCPYSCRAATVAGKSFWGTPIWETKCAANEVAEYRVSCPSTYQNYSCGFWGRSMCYAQVGSICCKSK